MSPQVIPRKAVCVCFCLLYSGQNWVSSKKQSFSFALDTLIDSKSQIDIMHLKKKTSILLEFIFLRTNYHFFSDLCNHVCYQNFENF